MKNQLRQEIINRLNVPCRTTSLITELKSCLILDESRNQDVNSIDIWLEGVIGSLFYKPNRNILILVGDQAIGKTLFLRKILPISELYSDERMRYSEYPDIYNNLIVDLTDYPISMYKQLCTSDGFVINSVTKKSDKRLASIAITSNVDSIHFHNRRRSILLYLKNIDIIRFNSINKHDLWIEIYNNYVEKNFFRGRSDLGAATSTK